MNFEELVILNDEDNTKVTFRMKRDLLRKLKVHVAQNDTNVTDVLNRLVEKYLNEEENRFGQTSYGHRRRNE
jgi:hypothetical protein